MNGRVGSVKAASRLANAIHSAQFGTSALIIRKCDEKRLFYTVFIFHISSNRSQETELFKFLSDSQYVSRKRHRHIALADHSGILQTNYEISYAVSYNTITKMLS